MNKTGIAKQIFTIIILLVFILSVITLGYPKDFCNKKKPDCGHLVLIAPESLIVVGDEAFSGTAFEIVSLNNRTEYIGNCAFWDMDNLIDVFIMENVSFIGDDAFSKKTVIHGSVGSYVQQWAEENGFTFINDYTLSNSTSRLLVPVLCFFSQFCFIKFDVETCEYKRKRARAYVKNMHPKERIELYPINYKFP